MRLPETSSGLSGRMFVLMEEAAEPVMSVDAQVGDAAVGGGSGCSGQAFAMPWCRRCWVVEGFEFA